MCIRDRRPYVSAQLVAVNGKTLVDHSQKPSDTLASLKDPIRLSWTDAMPANNRLVGGKWWPAGTDNWRQISAEPEVMSDMGFSYGDTLTYQINGKPYDFTLVASHAYQPGGSSITFWFQVPLSARAHMDAPTRFMGSMESVSYTHLDVYKRQMFDCARETGCGLVIVTHSKPLALRADTSLLLADGRLETAA